MDRVFEHLLKLVLSHFFRFGSITFITASGRPFVCGDGSGTPVTVRFLTPVAERRLVLDPELAFGEIYSDGQIAIEHGSIADVLEITLAQPYDLPAWAKWLTRLRF